MERGYRADGWLGIILGAKLYYEFRYGYSVHSSLKTYVHNKDLSRVLGMITYIIYYSDGCPFEDKIAALLKEMNKRVRHQDVTDGVIEPLAAPVKASQCTAIASEQRKATVWTFEFIFLIQ